MRYTFEKEFGYGKGEGNGEDEIIFNFFLTDLEQYTAHWLSFYHGVMQFTIVICPYSKGGGGGNARPSVKPVYSFWYSSDDQAS